jgi:multidrug transporter EmrE-like cation transporter
VVGVLLLKANIPAATSAVRQSHYVSSPVGLIALGGAFYASSFLCWLFILNRTPVARAYPIAIGITMALTTLGAVAVLSERLSLRDIAGIAIIFIGVVVLARA